MVRFTVTNSTALASGTRLPADSLNPFGDAIDREKDLLGQATGRRGSTQTITWTEMIHWPVDGTRHPEPRR